MSKYELITSIELQARIELQVKTSSANATICPQQQIKDWNAVVLF